MKKLFITGASSGIGMQLAKSYLVSGWHVFACGRDINKLRLALGEKTKNLQLLCFDLSIRDEVIENTINVGEIDLALLNAGTCEYIDEPQAFDSQLFERVIQTNVIGTAFCLEAILPNIKFGGQLAIVSSAVTLLPLTRAEAYGASKASIIAQEKMRIIRDAVGLI